MTIKITDLKEALDTLDKLVLEPNEIIVITSDDFQDAIEIQRFLATNRYFNLVLWLSPGVTVQTAAEEEILKLAEEIKDKRDKAKSG